MRGRSRESELVETPPHRAEIGFSSVRVSLSPQAGRGKLNADQIPAGGATSASGWLLRLSESATKPDAFISSTKPRR
jgi:hypothetical protein